MNPTNLLLLAQQSLLKCWQLLEALKKKHMENNRTKFYKVALNYLGTDVTPSDVIPDELDCANTVNTLHLRAFGYPIGGGASTYLLYQSLKNSPYFTKVDVAEEGDIVISPSGYGNGRLRNGHVGIKDMGEGIMSNDSATGKFQKNYTMDDWRKRYVEIGGYPMDYFRRV